MKRTSLTSNLTSLALTTAGILLPSPYLAAQAQEKYTPQTQILEELKVSRHRGYKLDTTDDGNFNVQVTLEQTGFLENSRAMSLKLNAYEIDGESKIPKIIPYQT